MTNHEERIKEHYEHAKEKHPYFCDKLLSHEDMPWHAESILEQARMRLKFAKASKVVTHADILNCELWEMENAVAKGNKAQAVEECYDAIAVLLRIVDVLEGRQPLGNPEGGAK